MRLLLALTLILLSSGCSTAVIRIVEYQTGTVLAAVSGAGIAVHQSGKEEAFAKVTIVYQGERATVQIVSGEPDVPNKP